MLALIYLEFMWVFFGWFILSVAFVYNDRFIAPIVTLVIACWANWYFFNVNAWEYIVTHKMELLGQSVIYILIGTAWSMFKWYRYLVCERNRIRHQNFKNPVLPEASRNVSKIICWNAYWPLSVTAFIVGDMLEMLYTRIYEFFSGLYDRITNHVFRDFKDTEQTE